MANLATSLHSVLIAKEGNQCPYEKFFGKMPHWISNMHNYGEVGVVNKGVDIISKDEYGFCCLFCGILPRAFVTRIQTVLVLARVESTS